VKVNNTLIGNKQPNSVASANVLLHINNFYQLSQSFQKSGLNFFKAKKDNYHLELINQMLAHILEDIKLIDSDKKESFNMDSVINYIKKLSISQKINIYNETTLQEDTIVANRELITSAMLLLILLQLDEHKLQTADLRLHKEGNSLIISIPENMHYNNMQKSIILSKKVYEYKNSKKKFYGLYLLFLKKITKKMGGKIKILMNDGVGYRVVLDIPVQSLVKESVDNSSSILNYLNKRVLIYSKSKYYKNKAR